MEQQHHRFETELEAARADAPVSKLTSGSGEAREEDRTRDFDPIVAEYTAETEHRKALTNRATKLMGLSSVQLMGLSLLLLFTAPPLLPAAFGLQVLVPFGLTAYIMRLNFPSRSQREIADKLLSCEDVRAITPLMSLLGTSDRRLRTEVHSKLVSLLRAVREEDASIFSDEEMRGFYTMLDPKLERIYRASIKGDFDGLAAALLHAVGRIGDRRVLGSVERLAARPRGRTENEDRVRSAAEASLPQLRERVAREDARQNLLSPASAPTGAVELLRPAAAADLDDALLLRPDEEKRVQGVRVFGRLGSGPAGSGAGAEERRNP